MLDFEINMVARYGFSATIAGLVLGLFGAGMALGSLIGGVLADRWGRRSSLLLSNLLLAIGFSVAAILAGVLAPVPHMTVFVLNAATQLAMAALVYFLVPETQTATAKDSAPIGGSIRDVFRDRFFMIFVSLNFGLWAIIEACKLIPIAMHQRGLDPCAYGAVISVNGVLIVIFQLFVPRLVAKRRRTKVLVLSALPFAVGMGSVAIAGTVPLLMLTVVVWTAGEVLNAPVNGAYIADLSPPEMRGRYQGVAQMSFALANFVAPVAGGMLLDHARPATLWLVLAGAGVLVAIGQWVTGPARERRALVLTKPHDSQGVPVASPSS